MATTTTHFKPQEDLPKTQMSEGNKGRQAADKAKEVASNIGEKAKEAASNMGEKAKEVASNVADKAKDVACNAGQKAEDAAHAVGSGMQSLAGTVREKLPQGGVLGAAGSTLASGLENTGRYLQQEGLKGMGQDLTDLIRRNPLPAILIGVGLGFILARATSRS